MWEAWKNTQFFSFFSRRWTKKNSYKSIPNRIILNAEFAEYAEVYRLMTLVDLDALSSIIIGKAIVVHRELGPGLLESAYENCLIYELLQSGLSVEQQKPLPIIYKGVKINCGYRLDIVIENVIIVELKSIEKILPIHKTQLLSYLRISGLSVGLIINFNVELLKLGLHRIVNNYKTSAYSATSALKMKD